MFSSAAELARFTIAFMNDGVIDGRAVLKPSAITTLSTGYTEIPSHPEGARYSYGLTTSMHRGARIVEHGGAIDGFGASIRMLPERKAAVVILVNKRGGRCRRRPSARSSWSRRCNRRRRLRERRSPWTPGARQVRRHLLERRAALDLLARDGKLFFRRGD